MIKMLTLDKYEDWQTIVSQFENHDIHYDANYLLAFTHHDVGEPRLIYFDNGELQAMTVVMQRDLSDFAPFKGRVKARQYYDFTTVFGYGGFLYKGDVTESSLKELEAAYSEFCQQKKVVSEFVKLHPLFTHLSDYGLKYDPIYQRRTVGHPVVINLGSSQQIWEDLSSARRRVIRKAQKAGVEIHWSSDSSLLETFIPMYNYTMDRDQASNYFYFSEDFYQAITSHLRYNLLFFYAKYEGEIIAMATMLFSNRTVQYFLSGSNPDFNHLSPTSLLIYEAAIFAQAHGYKQFFLGGGQESLLKYKQGFNKNSQLDFEVGKKVFNQPAYDELVRMRVAGFGDGAGQEPDVAFNPYSEFFPLYRAD